MLLGTWEQTIDEVGVLALPLPMRRSLTERVVMTRGFEPCVQVFPEATWSALAQQLNALTFGLSASRNLRRLVFAGAAEVTVEPAGMRVPPLLRSYADLKRNVVVVGLDSYVEIWSSQRWEAAIALAQEGAARYAELLQGRPLVLPTT